MEYTKQLQFTAKHLHTRDTLFRRINFAKGWNNLFFGSAIIHKTIYFGTGV